MLGLAGQLPPPGTLFYREFTNILEPLVPLIPVIACELLLFEFFISLPIKLVGAVSPVFPWCVGPLAGPTRRSSVPPESPFDEVPNELNILESLQGNASKTPYPR